MSPSDENLSPSDWDFWPTRWQAFPLYNNKLIKNQQTVINVQLPKCQCQPNLDFLEKSLLMRLVNCLLTAKKLFNQSCLHNLMWKSDYVTQWKFIKRYFDLVGVTFGVWDWTADIVTVIDVATPRWWTDGGRLKTKGRSCEHSAACIRTLAMLSDILGNRSSCYCWIY